jgi:hypothetical protein
MINDRSERPQCALGPPGFIAVCIRLAKVGVPVVEMTHSRSTSSLGLEFNSFLFASIDEDAAEAPLSVVSALARLDLDPWQEAAELSQLPRETAIQRLGALLTALPGGPPEHSDSRTIALRLIALLPRSAGPTTESPWPGAKLGASAPVDPTVIMLFVVVSLITMATISLGGHPSLASANVAPAPAPASGAALPKASPSKVQP